MRFVVANTIEETYDALRQSWWGSLLVCTLMPGGCIDNADGYSIQLSHQPPDEENKRLLIELFSEQPIVYVRFLCYNVG